MHSISKSPADHLLSNHQAKQSTTISRLAQRPMRDEDFPPRKAKISHTRLTTAVHSLTSLNSNGRPRFLHPYHSPRIYLSRAYSRQQGYKRNRQGFHACHLDAWLPPPRASRWLHALVSGPMCFFLNIVPFDIWLLLPVRRKRHSAFMENGASSPSSSSLSLSRLSLVFLFGSAVYFSSFRALDNTCLLNFLFPRCPKFEPKHVRLFNLQ